VQPSVVAAIIALIGSLLTVAGTVYLFWRGKSAERRATNKAVLAEIHRLLCVVMPSHDRWPGKEDPAYPLIPFSTPVYREHLKNIGGLDDDLVELVVRFYGYIDYLNSLQALRAQYIAGGKTQEFNDQYKKSLSSVLTDFNGVFKKGFEQYGIE
jgi:hypothetical protein